MDAALSSAVSALQAQSQALSTISNNLANSSTTGYKDVSTQFVSLLTSQTGPNTTPAGGVLATTRQNIQAQGLIQTTTTATDVAIDGNGMLAVSAGTSGNNQTYYTRNGAFNVNSSGNLQQAGTDYLLLGTPVTAAGVPTSTSLQPINVNTNLPSSSPTTKFALDANLPSEALADVPTLTSQTYTNNATPAVSESLPETWTSAGANQWTLTVGPSSGTGINLTDSAGQSGTTLNYNVTTDSSGNITGWSVPGGTTVNSATTALPTISPGDSSSTVTLPTLSNLSTGLNGVFSKSTTASIVDSLGDSQNVPLTWTAVGGNTLPGSTTSNISGVAASSGNGWILTVGTPTNATGTASGTLSATNSTSGTATAVSSYSYYVSFDSSGGSPTFTPLTDAKGNTAPLNALGAPEINVGSWSSNSGTTTSAAASTVALNFSGLTQKASGETTPGITTTSTTQNGVQVVGTPTISINSSGQVVAGYSNGTSVPIYQIPVAMFNNVDGLQANSEGVYSATTNSGTAQIQFTPGQNGAGTVTGGELEASNVDTSTEFANMITCQQAYSAASQVIGTDKQNFQALIQIIQ